MLIIALVLALIGLVALVFAVVTSNELVAWVCIGASVLGVVLLIVDAVRERQHRDTDVDAHEDDAAAEDRDTVDYPEEAPEEVPEEAPHHEASETPATEESSVSAEGRGDEPAK